MIHDLLDIEAYSLNKAEKNEKLLKSLMHLTRHHALKCHPYKKILNAINFNLNKEVYNVEEFPFLPVRLFKELDLLSIPRSEIIKTMTSSGTTGQTVSKIFLDKETSSNQIKALNKIVTSFIGKKRLPMIVLDTDSVLKDRNMFTARGAGILGFSIFSRDRLFAFDENMKLKKNEISEFLNKYENNSILMFGFTFMVWEYFYKELQKNNDNFDFKNGLLIHGGGWKKLEKDAISSVEFNKKLHEVCVIVKVHNYYGMVEQTGSIYMECEHHHLHSPIFSDVLVEEVQIFSPLNLVKKVLLRLSHYYQKVILDMYF